MYARLPTILTFASGIAVSAFTNIFTGLSPHHLTERVIALLAFAISSILFFIGATRADTALTRSRALAADPEDEPVQFGLTFGRAGWAYVILAAATTLLAVIVMLTAALKQNPAQP